MKKVKEGIIFSGGSRRTEKEKTEIFGKENVMWGGHMYEQANKER